MRLSEKLATVLANAKTKDDYVVLTQGAVDELLRLIEAAEAVVEIQPDPRLNIGFDLAYQRQLDEALRRLRGTFR